MRKITAFFLAILMVFSMAPQVFAATVSLGTEDQTIKAGEQIQVTIDQDGTLSGVIAIEYRLYYNADLFELTGSELAANHDLGKSGEDAKGTYQIINYLDKTTTGVDLAGGTLATLTFTAKETVSQEQQAEFKLVNAGVMDTNGDMIEDNTVENGKVSITVSPAVINTYTVTLPQGAGYTVTPAEGSASPVEEGGSYSFTVTVSEGYEGTPVVKANGSEVPLLNGAYTIEEITEDQMVTVEGITEIVEEPVTYTVTLPQGAGYTVTPAEGSASPVEEGGSYSFTVTVSEGYEGTPVVKANGSEVPLLNGAYTIADINADQVVTVEGITEIVEEIQTYTVTLPQGAGYTVTPAEGSASPVEEGGSFSFTVTVDTDNYEGTPVVKAGETELTAVDGVYTIADITANQTVTVEGITQKVVEPATYTVTLTEGTGYVIAPANGSTNPVTAGGSFSFTVTVLDGYVGDVAVKANSTSLAQVDGVYTITNINQDYSVTVSGLRAADAAVDTVVYNRSSMPAWPNGAPVFINSMTVKGLAVTDVQWDASYTTCTVTLYKTTVADASFKLGTQLGYSGAPQMMAQFVMKLNGGTKQTFGNSGYHEYSGNLVNGEAEITVSTTMMQYKGDKTIRLVVDNTAAPEPASYNVTLTEGEGYTIAAAEGSVSPVTEGGSFSFNVTVNDGYQGTPVVKANGTELTAVNGIYTIENITADQTVTVEGITAIPNTYTVTLSEGVGYTIAAADGSSSPVTEGGSFSFAVVVDTENYRGTPVVKANGSELTAVDGLYTIEGISQDVTVTVEGITLKPNLYTVTLTEGQGYTIAATGDSTSPVEEGGSFSFTVTANNGYEGTAVVKANGSELLQTDSVYTISGITEDQVVTVEGINLKANAYIVAACEDVTATKNAEATVTVRVTGNVNGEITGYNDYDVTLSYDPTALSYKRAAAAHSGAEITNNADDGTIRIIGHGDGKAYTDVLATLVFETKKSGNYEVTITSAKIDNSGNAISTDAPEAAVTDKTAVVKVGYTVTLPDNFVGNLSVVEGEDYRFTVPNPYYDITVTVGGVEVTPIVSEDGLVYTIPAVNGDVVITAVGKTYNVIKTAEHATITGGDTAQYGVDYSFTVAAQTGYVVSGVSAKIGTADVECRIVDGKYVISGTDITGDLTVTVTTLVQPADTTQITFTGVAENEVVGGLIQFAENGKDFNFELNEETGYVYTVKLGNQEIQPRDGVYTIPGSMINGTALTVVITKAVDAFAPQVTVSQYIQLDEKVMWLITATEGDNVLAYGEGNTMFWSEKYNAYCWLVISADTEDAVKAAAETTIVAAAADAVATRIAYNCDVNKTGELDVNDAQLTYDMYQAKKYANFDAVDMDKFLEADVNGDGVVNVDDAADVVAEILK